MKSELILLTDSNGFFGQLLMPWESLKVDLLISELSKRYLVRRVTYEQVANGIEPLTGATIIHASSQQPEYKAYIEDILLYLLLQRNTLVPSFSAVRAHENKGYQELYRRARNIGYPGSLYLCSGAGGALPVEFPSVCKDVGGFGSVGVRLVRSEKDLARFQVAEPRYSAREWGHKAKAQIGYLLRKYALRRKNLRPYGDYFRPQKRFVVQPFIQNLHCDYKVIVFQNRVFVLKRIVRAGDFRASGSGNFVFEDPPGGIIDYAHRILRQLSEPYASLDIAVKGDQFHLLEYQSVHFGPYTVLNAPYHFVASAGSWHKCYEKLPLERLFGESLIEYLHSSAATAGCSALIR